MTILKNIPVCVPPELLYVLAKMGHGDELVIVDANFPAASVAACTPGGIIRCDGLGGAAMLEAVLKLLPLDQSAPPAALMAKMDIHQDWKVPIWDEYKAQVEAAEGRNIDFEMVERFAFYERAKKAYAIVATGESAPYANIILKKGIIAKIMT